MACLAVLVGLTTATAETAQAAGQRADLVVTSVSAPARAMVGTRVTLRAKVRNKGTAKARGSVTAFRLSTDQAVGRDLALKPTKATPRLRPGKTWSGSALVTIPASVTPGRYFVLACADATRRVREKREGNNCRASAAVQVIEPASSHELIDEDVASGKLTAEQGLIYKVYSDYGDPRLPARYVGRPNGLDEGALEEAAQSWDTLSSTGKQTLRPFLIPPFYAGSHWTPGEFPGTVGRTSGAIDAPWCAGGDAVIPVIESWDYLDTAGGDFRIWWLKKNPGDATQAAHMRDVIDQTILPALTNLMGRGPKRDGNGLCDGGSDAVDIALVDAGTATVIGNGTCGQGGTSTHMLWPRTKPAAWAGPDPYLAHEVMHTIQFAMPQAGSCADFEWLREMTAQWTQDYVTDPTYGIGLAPDDTEFEAVPHFLDKPNTSLDEPAPIEHAYGAYLLAQWGARRGGVNFVPDIWSNAATMTPTEAINAALPGDGFVDTWADFALSNYNRGPVTDYQTWDQMNQGAKLIGPEAIPPDIPRNPSIFVNHLGAQYLELDIDPKVTELEVTNDLAGDTHAKMRAVVTYDDGTHKIVDLSANSKTWICIDTGSKRATKVVLIFSNSHTIIPKKFAPTVLGKKNCGCQNSTPRPAGRSAAADDVCEGGGNLTFSREEEITKLNDDGTVRDHTVTTLTGSINLKLVVDADDPETYRNDPTSTYTVTREYDGESYRYAQNGCGDETLDYTEQGAGTLGEEGTFTAFDPDSDDLWLYNSILMATHKDGVHHVECVGDFPYVEDSHAVTPECPPTPEGGNIWYEFEPVTPGSSTYSYSCTGEREYEDGSGVHVVTSTVSGTVTLPE